MRLLVVRHAKAKERDAGKFPDDALRPLSAAGRREFSRFAKRIPRWLEAPSLVLSSGWSRAWDTALLLETRALWPAPLRCAELETDGSFMAVEALLQLVRRHQDEDGLALVGHEPTLGFLIARLLGAGEHAIDFAKGAVAVLDIFGADNLRGDLHALVAPGVFHKRLKKRS